MLNSKYSDFIYSLARDVKITNHVEDILSLIDSNFTYKREKNGAFMSCTVYLNDEVVAVLDLLADNLDTLMFKSKYKKYAKQIDVNYLIEPKKGYHRILEWHKVKGFLHFLAKGNVVVYIKPIEITMDYLDMFVTDNKLEDLDLRAKEVETKLNEEINQRNKK